MSPLISTLYSVFNWVINSSIKASILILVVLFIRLLLKGKEMPKLYHILWLMVILRIMIPDVYKSDISIYKYVPVVNKEISIEKTFEENTPYEDRKEKPQSAAKNIPNVSYSLYPDKTDSPSKGIDFKYVSFIIWLLGLLTITGTTLAINIGFLRKVRKGRVVTDINVLELFYKCTEEMKVSKDIILIETKEVKVVGLLGFFSPKVLFPEGLIEELDEESLRYVFLHELAHLKRSDIFINWLTSILTAFHWFNPIVWYGFHKMKEDSELCCDSLVMTHLNNEETIEYGYTIVKLAENLSTKPLMLVTASMAGSKSQTNRRIKMITLFKKYSYKLSAAAVIVIVLVGGIAFVGAKSKIDTSTITNLNEIVVYNSHSNEHYKNGLSALETGKKLTEALSIQGLKPEFLEVPIYTDRTIAYKTTRVLVEGNIENYRNKVLLDIHITFGLFNVLDQTIPQEVIDNEGIKIILGKNHPNFKENDKFANKLLKELKSNNVGNASIVYEKGTTYNQDLSSKALKLELGSSNLTKEEVDEYINALAVSLKKISLN